MKTLFVVFVLALSGCAPMFNQSMSADQIKAAVADKSISAVCSKIVGPWGTAETTVVTYDQRVIANGGITVGDKCSIQVVDAHPFKPEPVPAPPPVPKVP